MLTGRVTHGRGMGVGSAEAVLVDGTGSHLHRSKGDCLELSLGIVRTDSREEVWEVKEVGEEEDEAEEKEDEHEPEHIRKRQEGRHSRGGVSTRHQPAKSDERWQTTKDKETTNKRYGNELNKQQKVGYIQR